ncbi:MAG TPA: trypsin-like peptidase domain-containing protein, partial [Planctomycetota bacterium]|nr:trypsin-like peptidase domain-containing protein [Planctomycetota bacterium]
MLSRLTASLMLVSFSFFAAAQQQDPRDQYGTPSLEAARAFQNGLQLSEQKEFKAALASFKRAAEADKNFQLAHYWMALSHGDLGDIEAATESYKNVIRIGKETTITNVTVDAAVNLALVYARLEKESDASRWFTEAIMLDPGDLHKLHWKAYRNMSIGLDQQKKHLSAAMCVVLAYQKNPERVGEEMVAEFISRVKGDEVGQILHFFDELPQIPNRAGEAKIKALGAVEGIGEAVTDLQIDVPGNRVVAIVSGSNFYYVIDGAKPKTATKVSMTRPVKAASLVAGELYLSLENPPAVARVDIATGKVIAEWKVTVAPASLAALPAQNIACLPLGGTIHTLNLGDGSLSNADFIATGVRPDPRQKFCFSYIHPGFRDTGGHVIINGRPVFFQSSDNDWAQTALFQYAVSSNQIVPAAFRLNAASNGKVLHVSADGNWIGIAGGGGWRPEAPGTEAGYGVAVFQARDLSKMAGFYATDAYPSGVAVNHITQHVAVWREGDGRLYHMNDRKNFVNLAGPFGAAATWTADGRHLLITGKGAELKLFELERTPAETAAAAAFAANLAKDYPKKGAATAATVTALGELSNFQIVSDKAAIQKLLKRIPAEGRTTKPVYWESHKPFFKSEAQKAELLKLLDMTRSNDPGIALFRLKEFTKKEPDHPVGTHLLGMAYYATKQLPEAEAAQIKAVKLDQGKTNVSIEALRMLAHLKLREKKHVDAAYCYSYVLMLDKANPQWLKEGRPFFERAELLAAATPVLDSNLALPAQPAGEGDDAGATGAALPTLEASKEQKALKAQDIYKNAANSVVLIKAGDSSGSGVCVGSGRHILTNHHVIENAQEIQVIPFVLVGESAKKMTAVSAKVVASNQQQDIAVLLLADAPESLVPLPVAAQDPKVGASVYAIGSPG